MSAIQTNNHIVIVCLPFSLWLRQIWRRRKRRLLAKHRAQFLALAVFRSTHNSVYCIYSRRVQWVLKTSFQTLTITNTHRCAVKNDNAQSLRTHYTLKAIKCGHLFKATKLELFRRDYCRLDVDSPGKAKLDFQFIPPPIFPVRLFHLKKEKEKKSFSFSTP